ncbi:UDP-glucose dehydrogenase family protein [Porphyromonas circumdentaria]|uniref:UDP-glucose 6-dehydrogenase n=1 Tax=Porphyromonas circumdentaria TaxID=29524 RepID=A0A1T4MEN1_9PORP|nr:UDP-glucose/GDP-mannose dehydrogenase family protein [Porphyromonas circumdentaria]MBB6275785.1 UDPglucose 6-dehydrogenase [Porphyromonas circumdentaria]SJZ65489.1 UDPglucose 6-dehydrogenase [Porphyromonas circumdentaria]
MNVVVVGVGYVGLVSGACFAEMGVQVTCVDIDQTKIDTLNTGRIPIYEPGLQEIVARNKKAGRLLFTTSIAPHLATADIVFSAVGTPPKEDGSADISAVLETARLVGNSIEHYTVFVTKSTVPVGTTLSVKKIIQECLDKRGVATPFDVVSNPEFLKEGNAVNDFMHPDRIVIGSDSERARSLMTTLYKPFMVSNERFLFTDPNSAEMVKYASNAMLATRISFMNDIANLCELLNADVTAVRKGIGADSRIGSKFLYPGCGYGGSCFPKDIRALLATAEENGYTLEILEAVQKVNEKQKMILAKKYQQNHQGEELKGKKIAIWGTAFKPETDDMRDAPSIKTIEALLQLGCQVTVFDPIAMEEAKRYFGTLIEYAPNQYDALQDADALFLITEWKQFRLPNWSLVKQLMRGNEIYDGRNIFNKESVIKEGLLYFSIGGR